jgi:hypothetical protein
VGSGLPTARGLLRALKRRAIFGCPSGAFSVLRHMRLPARSIFLSKPYQFSKFSAARLPLIFECGIA